MRVFIAINFNDPFKLELMHSISLLREHSAKGSFTQRDNLHLTIAFIGEVVTNRIDTLIQTMEKIAFDPFSLELLDLGQFKNCGEVLYFRKVACPAELFLTRQRLIEELKQAKFSVDEKEFIPHITLARRCIMKESFSRINLNQQFQSKYMTVDEICLMKSEQINGRLTYTKLYGLKVMPGKDTTS
jgi:2'-5' RNA ligase